MGKKQPVRARLKIRFPTKINNKSVKSIPRMDLAKMPANLSQRDH